MQSALHVRNGGVIISDDLSANAANIHGDVSMNKGLYVKEDVRIDGNLTVYSNDAVINTTTTDYQLIVAEDLSLNGRLFVLEDASFNKKLYAQTITDGTATLTGGALSGATTITAGSTITGGSFTDGTATISSGNMSTTGTIGSGAITSTAAVTGASLTDGTATLTGGALSGVSSLEMNGDITLNNNANIIPDNHNQVDIGSDAKRIKHIYAEDMTVSNETIHFGPAGGATTGALSMTGGKLQVSDSTGTTIDTIGLINGKLHNLDISGNMSLIHGDVSFNNDLRVGRRAIVDGSLNVADNVSAGDLVLNRAEVVSGVGYAPSAQTVKLYQSDNTLGLVHAQISDDGLTMAGVLPVDYNGDYVNDIATSTKV